jgi:hypothetical protein
MNLRVATVIVAVKDIFHSYRYKVLTSDARLFYSNHSYHRRTGDNDALSKEERNEYGYTSIV